MPTLFRRHSSAVCFFCHSPCTVPVNPLAFRCPTCRCWNRYDENGEIISEEPAMHAEALNANSFALRASASQDQLPTMYGTGPFCHTCQSNQLLIINLMSNFLPHPNDPEYSARLNSRSEYRESLYARYPPVCDNCSPAVEDQIRQKDHMARTKALGAWLDESQGKERHRRVSTQGHREPEKLTREIIIWRIRGVLWAITFISAVLCNLAGALSFQIPYLFTNFQPILPAAILLSLLWTAWDPTYTSFQRAKQQGRDVKVHGKNTYIRMQMIAWSSRLITACLFAWSWYQPNWVPPSLPHPDRRSYFMFCLILEITAFTVSCKVIRLHQPPVIRLLDTKAHKPSHSKSATPHFGTRESTPATGLAHSSPVQDPDFLAAMSLSSKPVMTPVNPVFGLPSLISTTTTTPTLNQEQEADGMDWSPTTEATSQTQPPDDASWLRPQRFFAPEKATGLERLFERTLLVDDAPPSKQKDLNTFWHHLQIWWWAYFVFLVPLCAILYQVQESQRITLGPESFSTRN